MDKDTFLRLLGDHVAKLRAKKAWSQSELARVADIERQHVHRLENGQINPSIFFLKRIANALEVTLPELVNF